MQVPVRNVFPASRRSAPVSHNSMNYLAFGWARSTPARRCSVPVPEKTERADRPHGQSARTPGVGRRLAQRSCVAAKGADAAAPRATSFCAWTKVNRAEVRMMMASNKYLIERTSFCDG